MCFIPSNSRNGRMVTYLKAQKAQIENQKNETKNLVRVSNDFSFNKGNIFNRHVAVQGKLYTIK